MRLVALGDVGVLDGMIHIGDEAMFEELVTRMRAAAPIDVTALSSNPDETAGRYGVDAVQNVGFAPAVVGGRGGQRDRLRRVLAAADGDTSALPRDDHARAVIEAVRDASAVVVTGGGNLASTWPLHVFERATLAALARLFDKPFVVSGQTIGPALVGEDRSLVAESLSSARLVGLREGASFDLVRSLGVSGDQVVRTVDDASFLGVGAEGVAFDSRTSEAPYCAVSLSTHLGDVDRNAFVVAFAGLLDRVFRETGLEIVFHAHWASLTPGDERGDSVLHRRIAERMTTPSRVHPTTDSLASAAFSRGAALHLTSRYHPAVFAAAAAVPTVGIAVDDYTAVKLTGALGNFGQSTVVTALDVVRGAADEVVLDAWPVAPVTRVAREHLVRAARATSGAWWSRVATALEILP